MSTREITPLKRWMDEEGISYMELAQELGFSYEYIFKIADGGYVQRITDNFQRRFVMRYGWDEASRVFDTTPLRTLLESLPA